MYRAEPDVNRRLAGGEKVDQRARWLVGVRLIVKREIRQLDVRASLRRLGQQTGRPQVGERDLVVLEQRRAIDETQRR
jgi:hypothetical protein